MNKNQIMLKQYSEEEIKQLLNNKTKLVYIDDDSDEFVARYEDLPDIIVDINEKLGHTKNLKVYDFDNPNNLLLTTVGYFLDKCIPEVRKDIIDRLISLQMGEIEVKDYKIIDEFVLDIVKSNIEEMEK